MEYLFKNDKISNFVQKYKKNHLKKVIKYTIKIGVNFI